LFLSELADRALDGEGWQKKKKTKKKFV